MRAEPELQDPTYFYSQTRLSEMPAHIAEAVREAMYADGYLQDHGDGDMQTFSPFDFMEPEYHWLRETYVRTALTALGSDVSR